MKKITISILLSLIVFLTVTSVVTGQSICESTSGFLVSLPPNVPVLHSPANEATQVPDTSALIWNSQVHAASYTLHVSLSPDFSTLLVDETSLTDTLFNLSILETNTIYYWRICASNAAGEGLFSDVWSFTTSSISSVGRKTCSAPECFALLPAYPNPFNPTTTITFHLPEKADVSLVIYNCRGQSVQELISGPQLAGEYQVTWNGRDNRSAPVTSGVYICRFESGGHMFTQKILLMR